MGSRARRAPVLATALLVLLVPACASTPKPAGGPDPADPDPPVSSGPGAGQRAQSAVEGMLMGAIIGAQAGPIGAAVGAGTLLIYSAITGTVPFQGPAGSRDPGRTESDREEEMENQIETQVARQEELESQIEEELQRQEELLRQIDRDEAVRQATQDGNGAAPSPDQIAEQADPRAAPLAPGDRDLPLSIFEVAKVTVAKGEWQNPKALEVDKRSLDADRDGRPEEIRYYDIASGELLRKEEDRDFDGRIDAWTRYETGVVVERNLDEDGDGRVDAFETYAAGRMAAREVDRNGDGVRDAFYAYAGPSLAEERHDTDNDGKIDRVVRFEERRPVRSEEDQDKDGRMDTWTLYQVVGSEEVIARIEKDAGATGKPDTFETYEQQNGETVLVRREEDKNGDGVVDVTSIYENGKLKRREISDPALMPL